MKKSLPLIIFLIILTVIILFERDTDVLLWLACFNIVVLSFNILVRRSLYFKPYFLSKLNIFSAKFSKEFEVDIPADLAFDKLKEVISESHFKFITEDRNKLEILAFSRISFQSWGENVYLSLEESGDNTIVKFNSAALFQVYVWGKNEDNYKGFFQKLEDSFTI